MTTTAQSGRWTGTSDGELGDEPDGSLFEAITGRFTVVERRQAESRLADADDRAVRADVGSVVGDRGFEDVIAAPEDS